MLIFLEKAVFCIAMSKSPKDCSVAQENEQSFSILLFCKRKRALQRSTKYSSFAKELLGKENYSSSAKELLAKQLFCKRACIVCSFREIQLFRKRAACQAAVFFLYSSFAEELLG